MDRETVACPLCGAAVRQPCDFPGGGEPPTIVEHGVARRVVHAARYALTLAPEQVGMFWDGAIEMYLAERMSQFTGGADPMTEPIAAAEPVFVIKGRDALAVSAVQAYLELCVEHGLPGQAQQVRLARDEIALFQARFPEHVRLPSHIHVPVHTEPDGRRS